MTSASFASLVNVPVVITEIGDYITRRGERVSLDVVSKRHDFGCYGCYPNGIPERWHKSGRISTSRETANDIVRRAED